MVEIGGKPILWHIMKIYSHYGINDFIICCGYKQYVIKEYFANYFRHNSDMTVDLSDNSVKILDNHSENWRVTMVDTGLNTMTGGRLKRVQKYIGNERFLLTYGDGVADVNIAETIRYHESKGGILTMTSYQPTGKFGAVKISKDNKIISFKEKPSDEEKWINTGFFVCEPEVFNFLPPNDDSCIFEKEPLINIARSGKMYAYKHTGFWHPMDTLKDNRDLNDMWSTDKAPWKIW